MTNFYIISDNKINAICNNANYYIYKDIYLVIKESNINNIVLEDDYNNKKNLNLDLNNFTGIKKYKYNNNVLYKINYISENHPSQIYETTNAKVVFYDSYIEIISKTIVYTYSFKCEKDNYVIQDQNKIFVFNTKEVLIFDILKTSITNLIVIKFEKFENTVQILARVKKTKNYFKLINIDLDDNNINIKKYINNNLSFIKNEFNLPLILFHLIKNDFLNEINFCNNNIDLNSLSEYFSNYDEIIFINNNFYLINSSIIEKISFKIENDLITEID